MIQFDSSTKMPGVYRLGLSFLIFLVLQGCDVITSPAKAKVSDFSCTNDFGVINGQFDAGVSVTFVVKNVGEAGKILVMPEVSTSEGEWSRSQKLFFGSGESKYLTYFFYEPTINSTNINCDVKVVP